MQLLVIVRGPFRFFHTECDSPRIMTEEDTEQDGGVNPWKGWPFWVLFVLVWIWISWMADDWSVGWKYRTPRV